MIKMISRKLLNPLKYFCTQKDNALVRYRHFTQLQSKQLIRKPNQLRDMIMQEIDQFGQVKISKYWKLALTDSEFGYYSNQNVFSKSGDFTTSPEISPLFGEMIAVWMRYFLQRTGIVDKQTQKLVKRFRIVQLGGGRGLLMKDIINSFKDVQIKDNYQIKFVETSSYNRKAQQDSVLEAFKKQEQFFKFQYENTNKNVEYFSSQNPDKSLSLAWYITIEQLFHADTQANQKGEQIPFTIFVMNEFMDALPTNILKLTKDGWKQKVLVRSQKEELYFDLGISSTPYPQKMSPHSQEQNIGDQIQISPESLITMDLMAKVVNKFGGCIINIDYGDNGPFDDSIRAIKDHKYIPSPYYWQIPGMCDLSAYVNFAALAQYAQKNQGIVAHQAVPQGYFLQAMGIVPRVDLLKQKADQKTKERLQSQYDKLVDPKQMGQIYKVQIITKKQYGEIYPYIEIDQNTF